MPLDLPTFLEPYRAALEATVRPVARIVVDEASPDVPWGSALGGPAYLPADAPWPLDGDGRPMHLLVRIAFAEASPMPGFPRDGVLQVFLGTVGDLYGLDFDAPDVQRDFRVVYHPSVGGDAARLADPPGGYPSDDALTPLAAPARARRLRFEPGAEPVSEGDADFPEVLGEDPLGFVERVAESTGRDEDEVWDELSDVVGGSGSKLGGYPMFTQQDPREPGSGLFLLLQLDSEGPDDAMMWGDVGVANFFIRPDDLARADFSRVLYNWDCT